MNEEGSTENALPCTGFGRINVEVEGSSLLALPASFSSSLHGRPTSTLSA